MGNLAQNSADLAQGYREIAAELGSPCDIYRSSAVVTNGTAFPSPIDTPYLRGTTLADFPRNLTYRLPIDPLKPQRVAVIDPDLIENGDYCIRQIDNAIYFVGGIVPFTPIAAVICNRSVSLRRQSDTSKPAPRVGNIGQIGNVTVGPNANMPFVLLAWPASVLYSGRGGKPLSNLPTDDTSPQWTILLPALPLQVYADDILVDDQGIRYQVVAAEENATGVRLICNQIEH